MLHARLLARPTEPGRRSRLVLTAVALLALVATVLSLPPTSAAAADGPAQGPNILLVTTDDQATTDMAFMPFTRNFFAEHGTTFTDAVSPYPLCCPARATILTGQLAHNHGVLTNKAPHGGYEAFIREVDQDKTLPTWLRAAGYRTMFAGKYLNGYGHGAYKDDIPTQWDEWHATAGAGVYSFLDFSVYIDDVLTAFGGDEYDYQTDVLGELTREFIAPSPSAEVPDGTEPPGGAESAQGTDAPFFIWESNLAPHGACYPTRSGCRWGPPTAAREDRTKYSRLRLNRYRHGSFNERVVREKPAHIRSRRVWRGAKLQRMTNWNRLRARSLRAVDRSFRRTINMLRADDPALENTLVIFTSDNGFLMGEHRWHGKLLPYQPSLGVPLMMAGPGIPVGKKVSDTVALVDIAPTIAAAAGVTPTLTPDGRPLQGVIDGSTNAYGALSIEAGPEGSTKWPTWLYRGVRTRRYTYVKYPGLREVELYDRRRDPDETTNVAYRPSYSRTRAALEKKLRQLQDCAGPECYAVGGGGIPRPRPERYLDSGATVHPDDLGSIGTAGQVVTVTARNWRSGKGRLTAWARRGRTWTVRRGPVTVQLGSNGLIQDRFRRQGAGETPAGTFAPERGFGLQAMPRTAVRYARVGQNDHWVFDPRVPSTYNVNQPRRTAGAAWRTRYAVRWAQHADRFPHALLMRYNLPRGVRRAAGVRELRAGSPANVRKGSFVLHSGRRLGRHGWVSMDQRQLTWLLRWMRPGTQRTTFVVGTPDYLLKRL